MNDDDRTKYWLLALLPILLLIGCQTDPAVEWRKAEAVATQHVYDNELELTDAFAIYILADEAVPDDITYEWFPANLVGDIEWNIRSVDLKGQGDIQRVLATVSASFADGTTSIDARLSFNIFVSESGTVLSTEATELESFVKVTTQ